ncbi:expressed unknown protein [Seminavis robusta]|uniref:Uncharacterized protein n=1 Tax=Seminavis robusta TaxID=568900 RepID=A0A9N8D8Y9_9STRA|nr:expressed unknown protein [Seminavis robusta]|eukprot:Sro40_g024610.1 n/a (682) ;mRNA; f:59584-61629
MSLAMIEALEFSFQFVDNADGDFSTRKWLSSSSLFQQNVLAAGDILAAKFASDATITVQVEASNDVARLGGTCANCDYLGTDSQGRNMFQPAPLSTILLGESVCHPEMFLRVNSSFVETHYWFDPTPSVRGDNFGAGANQASFVWIILHEMGHALGMLGNLVTDTTSPDYGTIVTDFVTPFDDLSVFEGGVEQALDSNGDPRPLFFNGTMAQQVYGGAVPLANIVPDGYYTSQNFYHFGDNGDPTLEHTLMNCCRTPVGDDPWDIYCLDMAVLADLGYPIACSGSVGCDIPCISTNSSANENQPTNKSFEQRDLEGFPDATTDRNGACTDHVVVYNVAVDIQMEYPGGTKEDCSTGEQENIDAAIATALNGNFVTTVPDWDGVVGFGPITFDSSQAVDNTAGGRQRRTQESRMLESACKQTRGIDCLGDYCSWGCLLAPSTSCNINALTNWANLADDIKVALLALNYNCLGMQNKLGVNLLVNDGTGSVTPGERIDADKLLDGLGINRLSGSNLDSTTTTGSEEIDLTDCKDLKINAQFTVDFFGGTGRSPSADDLASLMANTRNYVRDLLDSINEFKDLVCDVQLNHPIPDYDTANADSLKVHVTINSWVKNSSRGTTSQALQKIAGSGWDTYVADYARNVGDEFNEFANTFKIHFRGVAKKGFSKSVDPWQHHFFRDAY